jgi:hypothetical protein
VDPNDGSCWVVHWSRDYGWQAIHLAEDGTELARVGGLAWTPALALNPADGSVWVAHGEEVLHVSGTGAELLRVGGFDAAVGVSVNPVDSSCWVRERPERTLSYELVHLAEDGTELLRLGPCDSVGGPSVDPSDGSCWLSLSYEEDPWTWRTEVLHLSQHDWRIARVEMPGRVESLSVVQADHSCWLLEAERSREDWMWYSDVVHLADNGEELARVSWSPSRYESSLDLWASDPVDGSCWVSGGDEDEIVLLAADGAELWRRAGVYWSALSVNPSDGSAWVIDGSDVVHLVRTDRLAFLDIGFYHWAYDEVQACANSGMISGYPDGLYHPELAVTRDQMAAYISRALAEGDENVPEFTGSPSFRDVTRWHWASDYVEYALSQNVVEGYGDGLYHPEYGVTRDQMAVYVARAMVAPEGDAGLAGYVPAEPRNFPDVASDFWAYTHIEYCVEHGVVEGYEDGYYHPDYVVTRDQMAVYVARAFGLL